MSRYSAHQPRSEKLEIMNALRGPASTNYGPKRWPQKNQLNNAKKPCDEAEFDVACKGSAVVISELFVVCWRIIEASCLCRFEADLLRRGLHRWPRLPFMDELLLAASGVEVDKITGEQNTASALTRGGLVVDGRPRFIRDRPRSRGTGGRATNCC